MRVYNKKCVESSAVSDVLSHADTDADKRTTEAEYDDESEVAVND